MKACPYCGLVRTHSEDCVLAFDLSGFTPDEISKLNNLRRRSHVLDTEPMRFTDGSAVPWLTMLNIEAVGLVAPEQQD